jgi:hypothetical protein
MAGICTATLPTTHALECWIESGMGRNDGIDGGGAFRLYSFDGDMLDKEEMARWSAGWRDGWNGRHRQPPTPVLASSFL